MYVCTNITWVFLLLSDLPYIYYVGLLCCGCGVVVLCAMCFDELMSHDNVDFLLLTNNVAFYGI
jgi:hypothetical protein